MSDTRQALEEAFWAIFPCPDKYVFDLEADARHYKFTRFLEAEAWTDAALMLIPDGWTSLEVRSHESLSRFTVDLSRPSKRVDEDEDWEYGSGDTLALALSQACIKARENSDG